MNGEKAREDMAYITRGRHNAIAEKPLVRMLLYAIRNTWSLPPYTEFLIAQRIQYHRATKPHNNKFNNLFSQFPTLHKWWNAHNKKSLGLISYLVCDFKPLLREMAASRVTPLSLHISNSMEVDDLYGSFQLFQKSRRILIVSEWTDKYLQHYLFFLLYSIQPLVSKSARIWQMSSGKFRTDLHFV